LTLLALANLLPAVWLGWAVLEGDAPTIVQSARWLLAAPWALALVLWLRSEEARRAFAWGLVAGGFVNAVVVLLQATGHESLLQAAGLSSAGTSYGHYVYRIVRIPGMHGHPNASSAVTSLIVPASLYLYFRRHAGPWLPLAALAAFLIASHLTSTRSPLAVSLVTVLLALMAARSVARALLFGTFAAAALVPALMILGPPGGRSRWEDLLALQANTGERLETGLSALRVATGHPLGLGVTGGQSALYEESFLQATHNALLQAAITFGLVLALVLVVAFAVQLGRLAGGRDSPGFLAALLATQTLGLFFFEEHLNNPTFVILASWYVALLGARISVPARDATTIAPAAAPPRYERPLPPAPG
jgi:O-antigen ligase